MKRAHPALGGGAVPELFDFMRRYRVFCPMGGDVCSRRGCSHRGCAPHSLFVLDKKRMRRARWKRKNRFRRAPVQWPSARDGGRRIGACSDFALPSGTLYSSMRLILPSRGGWCGGRRGGHRIELLLFSLPLAWRLTGAGASPHGHPGERVAKRNARKEELVKCVLATRFSSALAPRESAFKSAPHPAAPVGEPS